MAESQQKVTIQVPLDLDANARAVIADRIIDFILKRTDKGLDKNNKPFKQYSEQYVNSLDFKIAGKSKSKVNLKLTGDMLTDLEVLDTSVTGFITIGFLPGTEENDKAAWQRNNTRSYFPKRDFLGITQKDLDAIVRRYKQENPLESVVDTAIQEQAQSILSGILGGIFGNSN